MKSQHVLSDRPATSLFTLLLAFAAMGCATRSFEPRFQAPPAPRPSVVISELTQGRPRAERPVAVGLSADPMRLIAWDLQAGKLWEQAVDAKSAPLVAADAVVLQEAQGVVVRDLATGAVRCVLDESAALIGVDGEGDQLIVSMALALPNQPGELALIQGDSVRWRQRLGLPVGVPALFGEYVVVPWATQRLSVLSAADGQELGRYHFKNTVMGHAIVQDGKLYVGQLGLLPVDRELLEQPSLKRVPYAPAKRTLPGQPPLMSDGYVPVPAPDNAVHRLQLSWSVAFGSGAPQGASEASPAPSHAATDVPREPLASVGNLLLLRFYRLVFGLDARSDELRWVRSFEHDVVGAAVLPGGVWLADSSGELRFLDQSGAIRAERALGRELRVLTLRPGPYTPPATFGDTDPSALPALREQLASAAALKDDRIAAARAYAVSMLARFGDAEVTSQLIALCSESDNPEPLRASACSELAGRKSGEGAILEALRRRGSFLEGRSAPPLGPLAQAAAKMQLKAAGPLLASHFEDPATSVRDLVRACEAISALEDRSAAPALERFVRLHHSEPEGSELSEPLAAAMRTLGKLRTPTAKSLLSQVTDDKLTPQKTRDQAKAVLDLLAAPPLEAAPPPPPAAAAAEAAVQKDTRAYELSAELVRGALAPFAQRLSGCFKSTGDKVRSARAQLVIDGEGTLEAVYVLPSALQACAEPILREAHFPATRMGRQRVSHNFTAEPQRRAETEPQPAPAKKPKPASARPQPAAAQPQVAK